MEKKIKLQRGRCLVPVGWVKPPRVTEGAPANDLGRQEGFLDHPHTFWHDPINGLRALLDAKAFLRWQATRKGK